MNEYNLGPFRIRPRGEFSSSERYKFLDLVTYYGSSYICCNLDTIDGIGVIGIAPTDNVSSSLYWQLIASKGDKGDMGESYKEFITVTNGQWDFSRGDKIFIPSTATVNTLDISNVTNGSCGMVITNKNLELPVNSEYSIDFNYVYAMTNQYYMYTFVYGGITAVDKFIWNRTVINSE